MISKEISSPFCNIAILTGTHPYKLKITNSLPVLKKGLCLTIANYRPISLLSNILKIFEKMSTQGLMILLKNTIFYTPSSMAFTVKHSTCMNAYY